MAAADVSGLIDIASSPEPSTPTTPTEPVAEETPVEASEVETSPETSEGGESQAETPADDGKIDARTNPDAIRKVLRELRDSDPAKAPIARRLNDIVGRESAYKQVFPKVADAKQAKFLLDSIGGGEGLSTLQATIKSVNETDQMLYNGDARVLDNILADMKAAGKMDAFGKLASPFLEKLHELDEKAYSAAIRPHLHNQLVGAGFADVLAGLEAALGATGADGKAAPDLNAIAHNVSEMKKWFNWLDGQVKAGAKKGPDPEREAFERERTEFQTQKQQAFQSEVNGEWNRANNQALGEALKPYMKLPFAKNWTKATQVSVAREITNTLLEELKSDKGYQAQMDALWSESTPDKTKIVNFHKSKLDIVAKRIVRDVLDARYPGFSSVKGAPAAAKPTAQKPATQTNSKPLFQSTKPKESEVDWDRDPERLLYISGRFYDRRGTLRTWNPRYK